MKRTIIGASFLALLSGVALANPAPKHVAPRAVPPHVVPPVHILTYRVAPADEYFGRLKMSILGIRNTIKDVGLKIDADPTTGGGIVKACAFTEDALHDWEKKYPRDTWLPRNIFTLERLYAKVDSDDARAKAKATMVWLVHDFPSSPQARIGQQELAENKVGVKPAAAADAPVPAATDSTTTAPATAASTATAAMPAAGTAPVVPQP